MSENRTKWSSFQTILSGIQIVEPFHYRKQNSKKYFWIFCVRCSDPYFDLFLRQSDPNAKGIVKSSKRASSGFNRAKPEISNRVEPEISKVKRVWRSYLTDGGAMFECYQCPASFNFCKTLLRHVAICHFKQVLQQKYEKEKLQVHIDPLG